MKPVLQWIFTGLVCVAVGFAVSYWLIPGDLVDPPDRGTPASRVPPRAAEPPAYPNPALTTFPDPTAPAGSSDRVFVDPQAFDSLILAATAQFTDKLKDEGSLREYREVISHRAERAKAQLQSQTPGPPPRPFAVAGRDVAGPLGLPATRVRRPLRGGP